VHDDAFGRVDNAIDPRDRDQDPRLVSRAIGIEHSDSYRSNLNQNSADLNKVLSWPAMARPRWLDEQDMQTWRAFLHASIRVIDHLDAELVEHHELTLADYELVTTLSEQPGGRLRMADLAARALVSKSRLSYRVDRLEERGLVMRQPDSADLRGTFAVLTPAGRRLVIKAAVTHVAGVRTHLLDALAPREQACVTRGLGDVLRNLDGCVDDGRDSVGS
jgi:DNA-binding MarR family transcriptional regulator